MVKKTKVVYTKKRQTGSTKIKKDKKRQALAPGKRISKNGKVYYEYRKNRTDIKGVDTPKGVVKEKPRLRTQTPIIEEVTVDNKTKNVKVRLKDLKGLFDITNLKGQKNTFIALNTKKKTGIFSRDTIINNPTDIKKIKNFIK